MKTKFVIVAAFLVTNFVLFFCLVRHFEFHTGMDGRIIWRCNNFTGKAEYSLIGTGNGKWISISSPKPLVPPALDANGFEIVQPASAVPDWAREDTNKPNK